MGASAEFKVILTIDSQGNAKIEEVKRALGDTGAAAEQANQRGAAAADDYTSKLIKQLGIYALITAAAWKTEQAVVGFLKTGIQAQDDFMLNTIGVAATLTDMAKGGIDSQKAYAQNLDYSKDMYNELELAAAKHFASGKDMIQAWNILSQKGIVLRKEEIDDLGIIVDKIKLATQGQVQGIQIAQELRAMLSGQSRQTDQLAMILKDRYGAAWEEIVAKHREAGDLLSWLAGEFKGLQYASEDVQKTLTSQKTTLETLISQVGRNGLEGMYADIVDWLQQANKYLREHREVISRDIATDWITVKEIILSVTDALNLMRRSEGGGRGYLSGVQDFLTDTTIRAAQMRDLIIYLQAGAIDASEVVRQKLMESCGTDVVGAFGAGMQAMRMQLDDWKNQAIRDANEVRFAVMNAMPARTTMHIPFMGGEPNYGEPAHRLPSKPAPTRPGIGGKEAKGGSGRDTTDTMENLILQLRQEQAKLTEGIFSEIDSWEIKIIEKMKRLAMDDQQLQEGLAVAHSLKLAKMQKAEENYQNWLGRANQDTTVKIINEGIKELNVAGNNEQRRKAITDAINKQLLEDHQKLEIARTQETKKYYDSLAGSSILIADQYAWKEKSLALEISLSREEQERWFVGKGLTEAQKDDYRALLALSNQAKAYNLERQKAVDLGTLEGWAIERAGEALKRERSTFKDMMTSLESFGSDTLGQATTGILSQQKQSAKDMGKTIVQSMTLEMQKKSFTMVWDNIAKILAPKPQSTLNMGLGGPIGNIVSQIHAIELFKQASQGSVKAAEELNVAAGAHKDAAGNLTGSAGMTALSAGQLGLSAAGLIVSGIGVLTGSKELLMVGTVLETAATLLTMAATISMAKWWHTGGIVAHQGLIVAHTGLAYDERPAILQTGEWILKRSAAANLATYGPDIFNMLNSGRLPVLTAPVAVGGPHGGSTVNHHDNRQVNINLQFGDIHAYDMTQQEADAFVDHKIMPAFNRKLKKYGKSILD